MTASPTNRARNRLDTRADIESAVVKGSLWTMIHVASSTPIAVIVNAVVARVLGPADYGRLALITLVVAVAGQVSNFSVSEGVVQWGAAAHARGDRTMVDRLLRASLGYHLLVQLPLLVIVVALLGRGAGPLVLGALLVSVAVPEQRYDNHQQRELDEQVVAQRGSQQPVHHGSVAPGMGRGSPLDDTLADAEVRHLTRDRHDQGD